ncbi:PREDICTED: uncharacterized protein LOC109188018 [Ipomoea nil]|uniref:uncharacterized protein LOC109188018 n=1 Tax=Ipomoea nil TaxID=35883 RepID=UPI000901D6E8|nr:PREDICTED: uncharacterized protein LOC109188018 [Ipomoea nil]
MDVKNAFLNGNLDEEVYMHPPPGYSHNSKQVCLLQRALYGLKQAPRAWFAKFSSTIAQFGFTSSPHDSALFVRHTNKSVVFLLLYVDDMIITGDDSMVIFDVQRYLNQHFEMKDLGPLSYFLGLEVSSTSNGYYLSQAKYAADLLSGLTNLNLVPKKVFYVLTSKKIPKTLFLKPAFHRTTNLQSPLCPNYDDDASRPPLPTRESATKQAEDDKVCDDAASLPLLRICKSGNPNTMRRALVLCSRNLSRNIECPNQISFRRNSILNTPLYNPLTSKFRFFSSSENEGSSIPNKLEPARQPEETSSTQLKNSQLPVEVEDVNNKELKGLLLDYFDGDKKDVLPNIVEAIMKRRLSGKHDDTDDELLEDFRMKRMEPLDSVDDEEFEEGFEDAHSTDEEIDNLYDAPEIVKKRMAHDEYFNMDDKKWDDMISEAIAHGHLKDTKECEEILEDMLQWDKLLPDEIKEKVAKRLDEISDMVEKGELEAEEGYALFKEFEDQMVLECGKLMEKEPLEFDESTVADNKKDVDDPPGEGPILRWQTRVVFAPGGDAWHPKNRKVKLAVTVKELGLSKHQFRRLRELVGKRYHPGRDELTITSERFEDREENRKDCLRTLLSLIEEAGKANKIVEDARTAYAKQRLKANPKFMARLHAKTAKMRESTTPLPA